MKKLNGTVYVVGVLAGANGHLLYLKDWPENILKRELDPERCAFCDARGLQHNTW